MNSWQPNRSLKASGPMTLLVALLLAITLTSQVSLAEVGAESRGPLDVSPGENTFTYYFPVVGQALPPVPVPTISYGLNFISSAEEPADAARYAKGLSTGVTWNRWPFYWSRIEANPDVYDWSNHDATVAADLKQGLRINAILLGTPAAYTTSATPAIGSPVDQRPGALQLNQIQAATPVGLYEPVFCGNPADCSDVPGPTRSINPANKWARFVFAAVDRYRPGGKLGQALGWPASQGVTHWAMWNEPDLPSFWDSSLADYARLLKVGYLAAKQADPGAQVLFGALANALPDKNNYYRDVLAIFAADPMAADHDYFHDILATHNYSESWQSWWHVYRAGQAMLDFGLDKPIWLDESGVPVWNDYPGPEWDPESQYRATLAEQADFIVQSAFYAIFAGADAIYHFQLYDGCGNQPPDTDLPYDVDQRIALCEAGQTCHGDAHGLFRNRSDAACFSQHPQADTARPNYEAFKLVVTELQSVEPYWRLRPGGTTPYNGSQEWIALYRPHTGERVVGLWARFGQPETATVPAVSAQATLLYVDGSREVITPRDGAYTITLPGATNQNYPSYIEPGATDYLIGGRPVILIEADPGRAGAPQ